MNTEDKAEQRLLDIEAELATHDKLYKCLLELLISDKQVFTKEELFTICERHMRETTLREEVLPMQSKLDELKKRFNNG